MMRHDPVPRIKTALIVVRPEFAMSIVEDLGEILRGWRP